MKTNILWLMLIILTAALFAEAAFAEPIVCSYSNYKWNVTLKKAVDYHRVEHPYSELFDYEIDEKSGCTVCEEDQQLLTIGNIPPTKMCKLLAPRVQQTLSRLYDMGMPINKLVGYRVGMTRGKTDENDNRTQFSNHSFGIALDINDEQNGLYDNCITVSENCRLRKGGEWIPGQEGSLTTDDPIVIEMKNLGFKWGGEIQGRQKDFMHFSPTGY